MEKANRLIGAYGMGYAIFLVLSSTSAWGLLSLASYYRVSFTGVAGVETLRSVGFIGTMMVFGMGCFAAPAHFKCDTKWASLACFAVGYSGLVFCLSSGQVFTTGAHLCSLLIGIGTSLSFIMWQRIFASQSLEKAGRGVIAGSMISALLYVLVSSIDNIGVYLAVLAACVLANFLYLRQCEDGLFRPVGNELLLDCGDMHLLPGILSSTWRYMLCIAAIGYVSGVARGMAQSSWSVNVDLNVVLGWGMFLGAALTGLFWGKLQRSMTFRTVYSVLFLGVLTGFLLVSFMPADFRTVFAGIANAAFSVVSIFMIITCLKVAEYRKADPVAVFGVFSSIVYGFVLAGRAVGDTFSGDFDVSHILVIILLSVYLLSFASVVANNKRSAKADEFDPLGDVRVDGIDQDVDALGSCEPPARAQPWSDVDAEPPNVSLAEEKGMVRRIVVAQDMTPVYCRMIKHAYGLTDRESDVLGLIMHGRDVAHMADTLFVSENTVRSHCKNLYRKLDVHSRQQVFDLVEEFRAQEGKDEDGLSFPR